MIDPVVRQRSGELVHKAVLVLITIEVRWGVDGRELGYRLT